MSNTTANERAMMRVIKRLPADQVLSLLIASLEKEGIYSDPINYAAKLWTAAELASYDVTEEVRASHRA